MSDLEKLREREIESKNVFNGRLLHVYVDEVRLPDGSTSIREYIKHPGAAAVVPIFENGDVVLIKQFRYPLRRVFYEVPAGKIDKNESPKKTARRELKEESGLQCRHLHQLAPFHPSIGYTDEAIYLFCGWDIKITGKKVEDEEYLVSERLPFKKAIDMVYNGKITDGKSMVSLLLTWHWWQNEGPFRI